jgi:ParB family transcriptional regulator, chromosome partitioning protein
MDSLEQHFQMSSDDSSILLREVEIHQLDLRYAHTRVIAPGAISALARSLDQFGQISPLVSVSRGSLILIDGYRRVAAMTRNGKDTAMAEVWCCTEQQAILRLLARSQERKWEAFEEAGLLRELLHGSGLSQARLARLLGKDPSWVTRRLDLLDILNEEWIDLIRSGRLSSWAASHVLAPLSRANGAHALSLAGWVAKEGISTRDLMTWFGHYQKSNHPTRANMVREPSLFLKAIRARTEEQETKCLREGPEGKWLHTLGLVLKDLRRLQKDLGALHGADLTPGREILRQINAVLCALGGQIERMHHDQCGNQTSNLNPPSEANPHPGYQQDS